MSNKKNSVWTFTPFKMRALRFVRKVGIRLPRESASYRRIMASSEANGFTVKLSDSTLLDFDLFFRKYEDKFVAFSFHKMNKRQAYYIIIWERAHVRACFLFVCFICFVCLFVCLFCLFCVFCLFVCFVLFVLFFVCLFILCVCLFVCFICFVCLFVCLLCLVYFVCFVCFVCFICFVCFV